MAVRSWLVVAGLLIETGLRVRTLSAIGGRSGMLESGRGEAGRGWEHIRKLQQDLSTSSGTVGDASRSVATGIGLEGDTLLVKSIAISRGLSGDRSEAVWGTGDKRGAEDKVGGGDKAGDSSNVGGSLCSSRRDLIGG